MLLDFILAVFLGLISSAELAGLAFFIGAMFAGRSPWSSGLLRLLIIATGLALIDDLCD